MIRRLLAGELDPTDVPLAAAVAGAASRRRRAASPSTSSARASVCRRRCSTPWSREGLIVPQLRDGHAGYTEADADVLRAGLRLLEAGFPLPDLLALARRPSRRHARGGE